MQGEILRLQSREIVTVLAEQLAVAAHVCLQSQRPVGRVTTDAAVVLFAGCVDVEDMTP